MRALRAISHFFALALALCVLASGARAEVVVLLLGSPAEPSESELTARIRGQTRDLPLTLKLDSQGPATLAGAGERARANEAQIVVWTEPTGPAGLTVRVLDVASGELRTRNVSTSQRETLASSTTAEMAALVVRSELSTLLAERAAHEAQPTPVAAAPEPAPAAEPTPAPPPAAPRVERSWLVALGYRPSLPVENELAHGFAASGRRELGKLVLGVTGHLALPITLSDPDARIELLRGGVRAEALRALRLTPSLRLMLGGAVGMTLTGRNTTSAPLPLTGEASAITAGATLGLQTELHWQWSSHTGLCLAAGVDGVLWRTKFAYELPQGSQQLASLARFEPWMILGFFARFGDAGKGP